MENENQHSPLPKNWAFRFFTIWSGQAVSLFGSSLVQFALVWYLTRETGSATILATATLVALLPQIVLGPFVGTLVDRWNRRIIMIVADSSIAVATLGLVWLFATGRVEVWHIFVIMAIRSLGGAFHHPAMAASTSLMVPDKHLARVAGANQTLQGLLNIAAPPLGALLLETIFTQNVLLIDVFTAIAAVLPLFFIAIPQPQNQIEQANGTRKKTSYWQDLRAGFSYVRQWKGLLGLIILAMMLNFLLGPTSALAPLVVTKIFNGGAVELGWVESTFGIGIITGGILLSIWGGFKRRIITSLVGIVGIGIAIVSVGLVPASMFSLLLAANFLVGFAQVFANGPLSAIFQSSVAPEMQGRVFSLLGAGAMAMMPLGLMIAGPLSDLLGIRFWFIFGGSICILMTLAATFVPAIMNIETNNDGNTVEELA
ncbi:MAG: MFS transporter [Anaerolineae bacterium]|jgi:MFS transporter, DHA3 family, macrolide efflux protein|nr:MFS transporter [Anaerolineae bacterium]MBT7069313.1 MFS transporter [Anaerolineae bacterium]MBT7325971.1 MFS transporter [Anaerolineae bacterium]